MNDAVNKTEIVPFFKKGGDWIRGRNTDTFSLSTNPETEDKNFIDQREAVTIVKSYKPSVDFNLTMMKGTKDYKLFFDNFFNLPTGDAATAEAIILYYHEKGVVEVTQENTVPVMVHDDASDPTGSDPSLLIQDTNADGTPKTKQETVTLDVPCYKAWYGSALMVPNSLDSVAATISTAVNFSGVKMGGVKIVDKQPVFIEGTWSYDDTVGADRLTEKVNDGTDIEDIL